MARNDPKPGTIYVSAHGTFRGEDAGEVPVPKNMPGVKGICLGGCIAKGIGNIREHTTCIDAHAHTRGIYKGWICFQMPAYFHEPEYEGLRMHELARITTGEGHTDRWRAEMIRLSQPIPKRYQRRASRPRS